MTSSTWSLLSVWKWFLVCESHISYIAKVIPLFYCLVLSKATFGPNFKIMPYVKVEIPGGGGVHPVSTNYVRKKNSMLDTLTVASYETV